MTRRDGRTRVAVALLLAGVSAGLGCGAAMRSPTAETPMAMTEQVLHMEGAAQGHEELLLEHLESGAEGATDCVFVCDLEGRICQLAQRICELTPRYADLESRCEDARSRCRRARERVGARCGACGPDDAPVEDETVETIHGVE